MNQPSEEYKAILEGGHFPQLLEVLQKEGYCVIGPTVRAGAIVYEELHSAEELPRGWTDQQEGGQYRLVRRSDGAFFGYASSPQSWKKFLHPPVHRLWRATRSGQSFQVEPESVAVPKYAFLGVRSCDLQAIAIQDKVFLGGPYIDPTYQARRERAFLIAVQCGQLGGTCFCVSMQTGPKATRGFDLALTEVLEAGWHYFVVEVGTPRGAEVLAQLSHRPARPQEQEAAERVVAEAARQMGRQMDTTDIKGLLYRNYEHPRWDNVAGRCLSCANCTMVCPTCFCTTIEEVTDLTGEHAERWRKWDSCFTMDFSYIHGGSVRASTRSRYRQWMTHKLATWIDQFGTSGCVGCGRCITWCPVAIDITEEVRAIRESEPARAVNSTGKEPHDHAHP